MNIFDTVTPENLEDFFELIKEECSGDDLVFANVEFVGHFEEIDFSSYIFEDCDFTEASFEGCCFTEDCFDGCMNEPEIEEE